MRHDRREVEQAFFRSVILLGKLARGHYLAEVRKGLREPNFTELREMDENIKVCEKELEKDR